MDRRTYLVAVAAVVAGCGGEPDSNRESPDAADGVDGTGPTSAETTASPASANTVATTSSAGTRTPTPQPASLSVADVSAPSTIQIGTAVELTVTVENAGSEPGTLSRPVAARLGTDDWTTTGVGVDVTVPARESVDATVELPAHPYVRPASYRVGDGGPVARTRFVARELVVGESYTFPNGIALSLDSVTFADSYVYRSSAGERTLEPADGERWLVGRLRAENTGDGPATAPLVADVAFYRGEDEFAYQHVSGNRDRYSGGELEPGAASEGDVPTDVPVELTRADLRFEHRDSYGGGTVAVHWALDG